MFTDGKLRRGTVRGCTQHVKNFRANLAPLSMAAVAILFPMLALAQAGYSVSVDTLSDVADGDTATVPDLMARLGPDGFISLREAILATNGSPGLDTITFVVSGTIFPLEPLPPLNDSVGGTVIDGGGQVVLDGSNLGEGGIGIEITSAHNIIKGLRFWGFEEAAILVQTESAYENTICGCNIGNRERDGMNTETGIHLTEGAHDNLVGGRTIEARNEIGAAGRNKYGILIDGGSSRNKIEGNYIGEVAEVPGYLGNIYGIWLADSANDNVIGGTAAGTRNVISRNGVAVLIVNSHGNRLQGNYMGLDPSGSIERSNSDGVGLSQGSTNNLIGGTEPGAGNVIAGAFTGVNLHSSHGNFVQGNLIGTDATGIRRIQVYQGIQILAGSTENTIGGLAPQARNVISGCFYENLRIKDSGTTGNVIQGNYIGVDITGIDSMGYSMNGIYISEGASENIIGGVEAGASNVICGSDYEGVRISHDTSAGNIIQGNLIGVDATGTGAMPNNWDGILVQDAPNNVIGGTESGAGNVIANSGLFGVRVKGATALGTRILQNSIYANASGGIFLEEGGNAGAMPPLFWNLEPLRGVSTPNAILEIFADHASQGEVYLDSIAADELGVFAYEGDLSGFAGWNITITSTDGSGNTSPFGTLNHTSDRDGNHEISLSELLRIIQFYSAKMHHCDSDTEDGYAPGPGEQACAPHSSDYSPQDWRIDLRELLRVIQLYNMGGYHPCPEGEDTFCPGLE